MPDDPWPRVGVLGAGAVGCYYGGMLARAGAPVVLVGRPAHVDVIAAEGLMLERGGVPERVRVAAATDDVAVLGACDVVLVCVKTSDTEDAARALARHLRDGAVVLSLQNGVDNVDRMRAAAGIAALPVVVYVAAAMTGPGRVRHTGRGDLVIGESPRARDLAALFARADVPCRVSDNVIGELWAKLAMNCAYNAISALTRARYARITAYEGTRAVMRAAVTELVAVAQADGVRLPDVDLVDAALRLADGMPDATSSTAQDVARGKRTEIDALNGHVAARGAALGVPTPVNATLHALVKLLEEGAA
ncbi:2-dehydropantoate 2-reductase (plasmid) [Gemmatirosa kalamazoonensis]|uniref:2-dehydropantoate 2-reductase n=1 Tax=Gemmatirosa kalamazoonensis TaxID=861299 RepID=W0RTV6_9BACT|nr:2-dehydropantoate 2-reductase [Gemmatirosa kalamazoonensis]AHG93028.1 2-dehydropantoate 2-reductase [Gemmatirosa kalamazoonensis]